MPEREVCSVPEREAWSACAGKGGLECMCRKGTLRVRVPERDVWSPCAGNGGFKCVPRYIISAGKASHK